MPKSRIFTKSRSAPRLMSMMLSGLRSRWTMPAACAAARPLRDLLGDVAEARHRHRPLLLGRRRTRLLPSRNSMTKYVDPSGSWPKSVMSTMCGLPMRRRRPRLLQEALGDLLVLRHLAAEDLDRDLLVDDLVPAAVDDPHPAFAEHPLDEVPPVNRLPDVGIGLRRRGRHTDRRDVPVNLDRSRAVRRRRPRQRVRPRHRRRLRTRRQRASRVVALGHWKPFGTKREGA